MHVPRYKFDTAPWGPELKFEQFEQVETPLKQEKSQTCTETCGYGSDGRDPKWLVLPCLESVAYRIDILMILKQRSWKLWAKHAARIGLIFAEFGIKMRGTVAISKLARDLDQIPSQPVARDLA